jgi:hypothetical protein
MLRLIAFALVGLSIALPLGAGQDSPTIYFGSHRLFIGMAQTDAMAQLSTCCKVSSPASADMERSAAEKGEVLSRFILSNDGPEKHIIGTISFSDGKVSRVSRGLDEQLNPVSADAIALGRALDRNLIQNPNGGPAIVFVSTRHERAMNGESEFLTFAFPNGRIVELRIITLDTPQLGRPRFVWSG